MRVIIAIIWSLLISSVVSYVLSSMAGDPFNFSMVLGLTAILVVGVLILGDGILTEEND